MSEHSSTQAPQWQTVDEAADYLGMSRGTLRTLMQGGRIPYHRLSDRVIKFRLADLDAYLLATRVGPSLLDIIPPTQPFV